MWIIDKLQNMLEAIDFFKGKTNALLKTWSFNLNAAGEQTIELAGNFIYVINASDTIANINIQFSRKDSDIDYYNLTQNLGIIHPFDKVHIFWPAQASKTLDIWIGNLAPELLNVIDNRSGVATTGLLTNILSQLTGTVAAGNFGTVQVAAAATQIIAANANRKSLVIQNLTGNTGNLYLGYTNAVAATVCFVCLAPGQAWVTDDYLGAVWGLQTVALDRATYGEQV